MSTIPPDLYDAVLLALFNPGMHLRMTTMQTRMHGAPFHYIDLEREQFPNSHAIDLFSKTCKAARAAFKKRLELYDHSAVQFHKDNTFWCLKVFATKSFEDHAQIRRLWVPRVWPYPSDVEFVRRVPRYTRPDDHVLKVFVVSIHRRRDQLAVQIGIHEHEGPGRVFKITDYDPDEANSDIFSDLSDDSNDSVPDAQNTEAQNTQEQDGHNDEEIIEAEHNEDDDDEDNNDDDNNDEDNDQHDDDDDDEDNNNEPIDTTIVPDTTDDRTQEELQLNISASVPRWIDHERAYEEVTSAEIDLRVSAWLNLQYENFFPLLSLD